MPIHIPNPKFKAKAPRPFIPIHSHWEVPEFRRLRGIRYNSDGKAIAKTGLKNTINAVEQKALIQATKKAARMGPPAEGDSVTLESFTPLPGRILLRRPPPVTKAGGLELPEDKWHSEPFFYVVKVGPGCSFCEPLQRVVLKRRHKPKEFWMGKKFYMGRERDVVALINGPAITLAEILQ